MTTAFIATETESVEIVARAKEFVIVVERWIYWPFRGALLEVIEAKGRRFIIRSL